MQGESKGSASLYHMHPHSGAGQAQPYTSTPNLSVPVESPRLAPAVSLAAPIHPAAHGGLAVPPPADPQCRCPARGPPFPGRAGEVRGASAFDVASSHLPPNSFPFQNLLANFKGLLASCLNPVH